MVECRRQNQVYAVMCQVKEEYSLTKSDGNWWFLYTIVANTFGQIVYLIKWLIHFPLLSLDFPLHTNDSAIYNLPTIFEIGKTTDNLKPLITTIWYLELLEHRLEQLTLTLIFVWFVENALVFIVSNIGDPGPLPSLWTPWSALYTIFKVSV